MTTRTHTARAIEVPDLVGDKADEAIQRLRELGLMPITWSAEVEDVNQAGFVLGLDPPAGTPVRPKASITMSVAAHPDFKGHSDDAVAVESPQLVQPPLTWPLSSPTGFAAATPSPPREPLTEAFPTAATPGAASAPASSPTDAASWEIRHDDAEASSAVQPTSGVAAGPYLQDLAAPVPTPDEIAADDEWARLRAAEAARHTADPTSSLELEAPPVTTGSVGHDSADTAPRDSAEALEEQARREARRRRARRRRRLTLKQKALVLVVLAVTALIGVAAISGHKPAVPPAKPAHASRQHRTRSAETKPARGTTHHRPPKAARVTAHHMRLKVHRHRATTAHKRTRTHVRTVTVHAPAPSTPSTTNSSPVAPASSGSSATAPANTGAGSPTAPATTAPTPSHQPTSAPSSTDSHASGTGGGSTLQSPDGTTAPPKP